VLFRSHVVTGGTDWTPARAYPLMAQACAWIVSQIENGLVRCHAGGVSVWGICSWRNIIDGYTLNGAVTEINAECVKALELTAGIAAHCGRTDDAAAWQGAADGIRAAMERELVSERTGLYLLNVDDKGVRHHDITGDLIFPVLFGIGDGPMRARILAKLTDDDMWTPYGSRTVSRHEPIYDPDFGYQLVGGLWPNLTAWAAFCLSRQQPERLVEGMRNIYRLSEAPRPIDYGNIVPGEFPERLHGETYRSHGMTMSPWMPPTFLWLGVEGLLGVTPSLGEIAIEPALPSEWRWIAVRNLLVKGISMSAFLYDGILYASHAVKSKFPVRVGTLLPSSADRDSVVTIALEVGTEVVLFAASDERTTAQVVVSRGRTTLRGAVSLVPGEATLRMFPARAATLTGAAP
jgi:hypothetical protein